MSREETVEEYLERGGKITVLSPSPQSKIMYVSEEHTSSSDNGRANNGMIRTVPWKDMYSNGNTDDPEYWKKLNKKMDIALEKIKSK